jgi:N-dimethylarginine dimethylaminohydrolase
MRAKPDLQRMRAQCEALVAAYEGAGVEVVLCREPAPPNAIFARDLFTMSPRGAWTARMAAQQRRGEEAPLLRQLAALDVPVLGRPPWGTFEGADLLYAGPRDLLLGVGQRTTATESLRAFAGLQGMRVHPVPVPDGCQHLLGAVTFFDRGRALVRTERVDAALLHALSALSIDIVPVSEGSEVSEGRAMNLVALAPGSVLMPADCPRIKALIEGEGVTVVSVDVSEYVSADGGIGCLTGILSREKSAV